MVEVMKNLIDFHENLWVWHIQSVAEPFGRLSTHSDDCRDILIVAEPFKRREYRYSEEFRGWMKHSEDGRSIKKVSRHLKWPGHSEEDSSRQSKDNHSIQKMTEGFRRWPKPSEDDRIIQKYTDAFRRWPTHSEDSWSIQKMTKAFRRSLKPSEDD